ncbi:uncharacterized protein LOC110030094 [Phalaenopsis equestris]|uniref:uncharacterized protein LOC110030094 n=1 Tax=Phalaenopsis equestris TaxID=78828 RepID=UPI0009E529AF|nr:uncharacterized protein LOC110030094 [Phalaenopsis equestris]XP_020588319.1 uncharacterized protein LOC110030094 [Phalaenopsis equestris]
MGMVVLRSSSLVPKFFTEAQPLILNLFVWPSLKSTPSFRSARVSLLQRFPVGCRFVASAAGGSGGSSNGEEGPSLEFLANKFPISGAEDALLGFMDGRRKATDVAHSVWKNVIRGGDRVVDATCGNGYDTLALLKLIADDSRRGCVHGLDIQNSALENTDYLLRESVVEEQRELVKLSLLCHSRMEDILSNDTPIRLIAFNLGYLPGGDKAIITKPHTTLFALQTASRIISPGGLISIIAYVGHPGGREEFEAVLSFASSLPVEGWNCFKFETANKPGGPVLIFIFRK